MKAVTMAEVAKKANVSKSTVSQYINGRYKFMSLETKERVKAAVEEMNYMPNHIARSLTQKKTMTIGVIVANILHSFSTQVLRAIEDICNNADMHVIICNADDRPEKERNYINMLSAKQVDGLIIFPTGGNIDLYEDMMKKQFPLVFIDRNIEETDATSILLDNEKASGMLVEHLCERGYKRIAFITSSLEKEITPRLERLNGYKMALEKHSLSINKDFYAGVKKEDVQKTVEEMLSQDIPPDALICGNDLVLLETLKFFREKGIKVPADIALVSIDEVPYSEIHEPPLTIVSQPAFDIGKHAANTLLMNIEKKGSSNEGIVRYPPTLIVRNST